MKDSFQPIDLFIGSDGIFGIVTEVTIKLIRPPTQIISMILFCNSFSQALDLIKFAQDQRKKELSPVPLSVELIDKHSVDLLRPINSQIPRKSNTIVYLEQDAYKENEMIEFLEFWIDVLSKFGIQDSWVEDTYSGIEKHKAFRHSLPETVNSLVKRNGQAKLGTDYSFPEKGLKELFDLCFQIGNKFDNFRKKTGDFDYPSHVLWAHAGDNHVHLNFLPKNSNESEFAKKLMVEMMLQIVKGGGSISAEHGLGKKEFLGKKAIYYQYSSNEVNQLKKIKNILDPNQILNIENLF